MYSALKHLANSEDSGSLATQMRRKRFSCFLELLSKLTRPISILDVGGTMRFWELMIGDELDGINVTLLNQFRVEATRSDFMSVEGDARDMPEFQEKQFDVVFSNSVIEHVGTFADQQQMANEIIRVGKRLFLQTPNRYFPMEPHYLFPFFQFLPLSIRVWLVMNVKIGWYKYKNINEARREIEKVRLLSQRQLEKLFPNAVIRKEKFVGLTKSFMVVDGWENE